MPCKCAIFGHEQRITEDFTKWPDNLIEEMIKISSSPVMVQRMPFGKHKGLKMGEVPLDYLEWLSGTSLDEDLAYTVKHYLSLTRKGRAEYDIGI